MNTMTKSVTFRLRAKTLANLKYMAAEEQISLNALCEKILKAAVREDEKKEMATAKKMTNQLDVILKHLSAGGGGKSDFSDVVLLATYSLVRGLLSGENKFTPELLIRNIEDKVEKKYLGSTIYEYLEKQKEEN